MSPRPSAPPFPIVAWLNRRTRGQRWAAVTAVALVGVGLGLRLAASTWLDRWWLATVTDAPVWSTKVGAQVVLAVAATMVSGVVLLSSVGLACRSRPAPGNHPNRLVARYRDRMGAAHVWVLVGVALYVTVSGGLSAMTQWQPWLLFLHGPAVGPSTPDVGFGLGYHLFRLPFVAVVSAWLRQLVIVAGVLALWGYVATGALKIPRDGRRSSPRVFRHMALLAAAFAVIQALTYVFVSRPSLATNRQGAFDGPSFTLVRVVRPSLAVLAVVAAVAAVVALRGARTGRWRPLAWTLGTWAVLAGLLTVVVPMAVQRLVVAPAEGARELPYIAHNLDATRTAYGLDSVEQVTQPFTDGLAEQPSAAQTGDLTRMPLFGGDQLVRPLQVLVGTTATRISDVDLDRYTIDGTLRPVLIATRNANAADLPEQGWVQKHLVYTHGDGTVAVPADQPAPDGRPDVGALAQRLAPDRPELYFGEGLEDWYAIVGTRRAESGGGSFDADTGIELSTRLQRAVLALTVGQLDPLVSAELTGSSRLLYRRGLKERLQAIAPFLKFDGNAYPVVADGRVTWVIDGYTTASTYPYAQFARTAGLPGSSGLTGRPFNYLHASVKATVDAYDGSVRLYRTEVGGANDPVLDAWTEIFPGLIEPIAGMPDAIRDHLLYAPDLLTVQTALLGRYHVSDAETLFNGTDSWAVSAAPGTGVARGSDGASKDADTADAATPGTRPSPAVSLFMPGTGGLGGHWVAIRPYGPGAADKPTSTRDDLTAIAIADHDNPERLRLIRFDVRPGQPVSSPLVAQSAIDTDRDLASLFTLLNANGSAVQFGPMTPLPLDGALVWARPIIVTGTAATTTPRMYGVAAVTNGLVDVADEVATALTDIVSGVADTVRSPSAAVQPSPPPKPVTPSAPVQP